MRTAEALVSDLLAMGRSRSQILTVARTTHGGKLFERVSELLGLTEEEMKKQLPAPQELHEFEYCSECGTPLVKGKCSNEDKHTVEESSNSLLDDVVSEAVQEYFDDKEANEDIVIDTEPASPPKKKRMLL